MFDFGEKNWGGLRLVHVVKRKKKRLPERESTVQVFSSTVLNPHKKNTKLALKTFVANTKVRMDEKCNFDVGAEFTCSSLTTIFHLNLMSAANVKSVRME